MSPSITELAAVLLVSVCNSLGSRANWKSCCPRAVALAMCWSAVCSAPLCCNGMVFTLALQGFVRSCIETGLSVSIYIVYWRCNSYLKWTWVMGKVYSIYLFYKFFSLLMLFTVNSVFIPCIFKSPIGCRAHFRCKGETRSTSLHVYSVDLLFRNDTLINISL